MLRDGRNGRWIAAMIAALPLAACVSGGGEPRPPAPLAEDREQPVLALFEHVLTGYFAAFGANPPTTCATLRPGPLSAEQEEALIVRFVRLAPASRCVAAGAGLTDSITGEPAQRVEVYSFTCASPELCTGWVTAPGHASTRYAMRFEHGAWRFTADLRRIADQ
jgi:hypothetical protein